MREKKSERWLLIAIVLIACNLRAAITGVGSLVGMIQRDLSLSSTVSGLITTIPLLAFAAVSPLASGLAQKRGLGKTLFAGFVVLAAGILVRSYLGTAGLFLGTVLVGGGIAVGNVLIPALIKGRFPQRVGSLTSLYTTAMAVFSGVAAGVSVPLANQVGWRNTLAIWVVLAVLALIVWFPQRGVVLEHKAQQGQHKPLLKSGTAWWVSVYMGVQSLLFYSFVAWLPTILQAKGLSAETAGYFFSVYQLPVAPAGRPAAQPGGARHRIIPPVCDRPAVHTAGQRPDGFAARRGAVRLLLRRLHQPGHDLHWPADGKRRRCHPAFRHEPVHWLSDRRCRTFCDRLALRHAGQLDRAPVDTDRRGLYHGVHRPQSRAGSGDLKGRRESRRADLLKNRWKS